MKVTVIFMAFDGGFIHVLLPELSGAVDCHIDKIYQPSRNELVFLLRKKAFVKRLVISAQPGAARLHFTNQKYENPDSPPMFCMLVRKYLSAARLTGIVQNGLERVAELVFSSTDELGDRISPRLICELIGNQANVILVNDTGRIIDCLRRSDLENGGRLVQPGAVYEYPPSQRKTDPLTVRASDIADAVLSGDEAPLSKALQAALDGFSPLICRETAFLAGGDGATTKSVSKTSLEGALECVTDALKSGGSPVMLYREDGVPFDFSYIPIKQYGGTVSVRQAEDYSSLLDSFYAERENAAHIRRAAQDVIKLVSTLRARTERKLALRLEELKKCSDREQLRIYGELLKANLHAVTNGSSFAEVADYYDPEMKAVRIPMNPALTPSANASKYFKDYKKSYTAEQTLTGLTENDRRELEYFDSVLDSISRCVTVTELNEIRDELSEAGYIRRAGPVKRKKPVSDFKEYTCPEGYRVLVGKNNLQNDLITTRLASKNDLWFHVRGIPGSHVVVFSDGGAVSDETVLRAAQLAAFNSKASSSSQVPVDYTPVKYVRKPNGAKPGMVIYTTNKTVFVTPREDAL